MFNASRVQLSYPSLASLLSMQLTFEYQVVIYTRRSISKRVLKKWFDFVVVIERRNAVRGQECHDDLERRKAAYPNRVDSRVSGRPTSQRLVMR